MVKFLLRKPKKINRLFLVSVVLLLAISSSQLNAQTFYYGTGSVTSPGMPGLPATPAALTTVGNDVTVTTTGNIAAGTYHFHNFTINASLSPITVTGTGPLIIYCTGTCSINSPLTYNGSAGNSSVTTTSGGTVGAAGWGGSGGAGATPATAAVAGTAGSAFASATNSNGTAVSTGTTNAYGGGGGGGVYTTTNATAGTAGTGGGSAGAAGTTAYGGTTDANGCPTTNMTASSITTNLLGGAGGAGGGSSSGNAANRRGGGAGGNGGGAIQISAQTLTFGGSGIVTANGGNGGNGFNNASRSGGGGGGGSGGTILLQYVPSGSNYTSGNATVTGGTGGAGGGGANGGGGGNGGNGRIYVMTDAAPCGSLSGVTQASNIAVTNASNTIATVSWTRGTGDKVLVIAHANGLVNYNPYTGTDYSSGANAVFGSGTQIGIGNYVVYSGTGTSVNVTGLNLTTGIYSFAVYEYTNSGFCYLTPAATGISSYVTTALAQSSTSVVALSSTSNSMVQLQVVSASGGSVTSITYNTTGTTNTSTDITNAKIFYTGTSSTFATGTQFGSTVASPGAGGAITGTATLAAGINYFWLAYDIPSGATPFDNAAGAITSVTLNGTPYTPQNTSTYSRPVSPTYCAASYLNHGSFALIKQVIVTGAGTGASTLNNLEVTPFNTGTTGYTDYTSSIAPVNLLSPSSNAFSVLVHNISATYQVYIWVDLKNDGVFTDVSPNSDLVGTTMSFTGTVDNTFTGNLVIPSGISAGLHRMRIRSIYDSDPAAPCGGGSNNYGECEDYFMNIVSSCTAPVTQASNFADVANNTDVSISWTPNDGNEVLVIARAAATAAVAPVNGVSYSSVNGAFNFGQSTTGTGNYVVYNSAYGSSGNAVDVTGLTTNANYSFDVYEYNSGTNCYIATAYTNSATAVTCTPPTAVNSFSSSAVTGNTATINWSGGGSTNTLIVARAGGTPTAPTSGASYTANLQYNGGGGQSVLGTGYVVYFGTGSSANITGLTPGVTYSFDCYSYNTGPTCYSLDHVGTVQTVNPMSFTSSTTTQNTTTVIPGATSQEIVGLQVVTSGNTSPLALTSLTFNTTGSTAPLTDIIDAKIYFTGNSSTFGTGTLLATITNPNGTYTLDGSSTPALASTTLAAASTTTNTNYFWIAYDIQTVAGGAAIGDYAAAAVTSIVVSGNTYTPTSIAAASRQIEYTYCSFGVVNPGCNGGFVGMSAVGIDLSTAGSPNTTDLYNGGCVNTTYTDYSSTTYNVTTGTSYILTTTLAHTTLEGAWPAELTAYVDWGNDGLFTDAGDNIWNPFTSLSSGSTGTVTFTVPGGATPGFYKLRVIATESQTGTLPNSCGVGGTTAGQAYDFTLNVQAAGSPMTYVSSTTTQNYAHVAPGTTGQQIVGLQVVTTGINSPINVTSITFNTTGSTNAANDMANATLYYTGLTGAFSATNQFGSVTASPNGSYTVTGAQALSTGVNYFWLAYDCNPGATVGDFIDAAITGTTVAGVAETPASIASANQEVLPAYCTPTGGTNIYGNGTVTQFEIQDALNNVLLNQTTTVNDNCCAYIDYAGGSTGDGVAAIPTLVEGETYTISGSRQDDGNSTPFNYGMNIYADYNNTGAFNTTGVDLIYKEGQSSTDAFSFSYTVPGTGILTGQHVLRIRTNYQNSSPAPCGNLSQGAQGMDFYVNIACSTPTITLTNPTSMAVCSGVTSVNLNYSATTNAANTYGITWSAGAISAGFANVSAAALTPSTIAITVPAAAAANTYTGTLTVTNACGLTSSGYSISVTVNALPANPAGLSNQSVCGNGNVIFTVSDPGSAYTVQWFTTGSSNDDGTGTGGSGNLTKTKAVSVGSPITEYALISNNTTLCVSSWAPVTGTANAVPSITPGTNPTACLTATSTSLNYTAATGSPDKYSIVWGGTALSAGFTNVTNNSLPVSPITITVPGAAAANIYGGTLSVTNSSTTCVSSNYSISVTSQMCNSTWSGPANGDWSTGSNWSPAGVPNSCSATVIINSGSPVISTTDINVGDITLGDGAVLTLNGKNLNVCGSWTGGTSSNAAVVGNGTTFLNSSTSAQTINGNTKFDILQINNGSGVALASRATVSIATGLQLQHGPLDVSAGTLHLLSTAANNNSYIDDFTGDGTLSPLATIIADRYIPVGGRNQHFISSPLGSVALSQIGASGPDGSYIVPTSDCDERQSDPSTPYGSVFTYVDGHEPSGGCVLGNWRITTAGNMLTGKGYSTYLNGNSTLSVTGTANTGNLSATNLNNTGYATMMTTKQRQPEQSGWNLVGNPYPSAIDLTHSRSGFDDEVQVWQTTGPFSGTWQSFMIGTDAHIIIPPFQGFMVRSSVPGNGSYSFLQSERTRSVNQTFYRNATNNMLQLNLDYNGMKDVTTVGFNPSATNSFDGALDADKPDGGAGRPTLYTYDANDWYALNTLPSLTQTATVPMGLRPENTGTMTLSPTGIESFDPTSYILLEDKQTSTMFNLRNGAYTFNTNITDDQERFVLHFTPPAQILTSDASCEMAGLISIQQPGSANWNYTVTDATNNILSSGVLNQYSPVSVSAPVGVYTLTLTDNTGYKVVKTIQVAGFQEVMASFTSNTTTTQVQQPVQFTNTSNSNFCSWDFGDGASSTGINVTHSYQNEGVYSVTLTVTNAQGCTSEIKHNVTVTSRSATGVNNIAGNNSIQIWSSDNRVFVDFSKQGNVDAQIDLYNVLDQLLSSEKFGSSTIYSKQLVNTEAAYVIVKVINGDGIETKKVFIANTH